MPETWQEWVAIVVVVVVLGVVSGLTRAVLDERSEPDVIVVRVHDQVDA